MSRLWVGAAIVGALVLGWRSCVEFDTPECVALVEDGVANWKGCVPLGNLPGFLSRDIKEARLRFDYDTNEVRGYARLSGTECRRQLQLSPRAEMPEFRKMNSDKWWPWESSKAIAAVAVSGRAVVARDERGFSLVFQCDQGAVYFLR